MPKKMLIDATHPEETRVVVVDGSKVEDFDFESINKRQLAGNIYLAKVTRVEPSLQAAFIEYGGNRHGFLAFSEIHPDYYQIPMADREALLAAEAEADASDDEDDEPKPAKVRKAGRSRAGGRRKSRAKGDGDAAAETAAQPETGNAETGDAETVATGAADAAAETGDAAADPALLSAGPAPEADAPAEDDPAEAASDATATAGTDAPLEDDPARDTAAETPEGGADVAATEDDEAAPGDDAPDRPRGSIAESAGAEAESVSEDYAPDAEGGDAGGDAAGGEEGSKPKRRRRSRRKGGEKTAAEKSADASESVASDSADDEAEADTQVESVAAEAVEDEVRPRRVRARQYKIQEVIKVRQILLVQVVKEERGNKGAALTTYLSLAGRYCVLMPNTARGGGISRKITNAADRKKLKDIAGELEVPKGMGLIVRTAGAQRTRAEIKRDYEFLLRQWEQIRDLTLKSVAPALIYEEGSLIKRSIRDLYSKDIDEILVEGEDGYREAKDYMRMLMPSHAKNVQPYRDPIPLFSRHQVESYLASMFNPTVQLKSGGYIVIGVTEALVAIDVNSGRSTREGSIEETALKTNLEAADEIARQLRLRDLAGLIVIDFIDMDERRNNAAVEKRMKERLKADRARIQIGRISPFGLMEMSRQRLRPGMLEASTSPCPHCHGTGIIRSEDSLALSILRDVEEEGVRRRASEVKVSAPVAIANFLVNRKREHVAAIETRYGLRVLIEGDPTLISPNYRIDRQKAAAPAEAPRRPAGATVRAESAFTGFDDPRGEDVEDAEVVAETSHHPAPKPAAAPAPAPSAAGGDDDEAGKARRRRGKRGGRKRRRRENEGEGGGDPLPVFGDEGDEGEPMEVAESPFGPEIGGSTAPERATVPAAEVPAPADGDASERTEAEPATAGPEVETAPEPATLGEPAEAAAAASDASLEPKPAADAEPAPAAAYGDDVAPEDAAPEEQTASAPEPAAEPETPSEPEPERPRRRGWWSVGLG